MNVDTNLPRHVQKIRFVLIQLVRPRILHGLTPRFFYEHRKGTNDHEQPRPVPLVPMLFGGRLRHALSEP